MVQCCGLSVQSMKCGWCDRSNTPLFVASVSSGLFTPGHKWTVLRRSVRSCWLDVRSPEA